jgi:hypothetical protein
MEQLEGTVASIVFQSNDQGFSVFSIKSQGTGKVTAVYKGPAPFLGEHIIAQGMWQEHQRFGRQFSIQTYQTVMPSSVDGIERFLASGAVKGVLAKLWQGALWLCLVPIHWKFWPRNLCVWQRFPASVAKKRKTLVRLMRIWQAFEN